MKRSKYEKVLVTVIILFAIATVLCKSLIGACIESTNAQIQRIKSTITVQEETNVGMQMKINELASLDNALSVAQSYGLSYNNSNIKVIEE